MISKTPKIIVFLLAVIVLSGGISVMDSLYAQQRKKKEKTESFTRQAPTPGRGILKGFLKFHGPVQAAEGSQPPAPVQPEPRDPSGQDLRWMEEGA